ncbi:hypothetical protein K466DRAFT_605969, partial [Polyporus arcularius HHB13444]
MSHLGESSAPAPTPIFHQPPVKVGPYEDVSVLAGHKRPPTGPDLHKSVLNGKSRKLRSSMSALPLRSKPYFQHSIREDDAARRERQAREAVRTDDSETTENERARKRAATRQRPSYGAASRGGTSQLVFPSVAAAATAPSTSRWPTGYKGATVVSPPSAVQPTTITVPIMQTTPSQQVPMHLLHPKMLPPALLQFLRDLYLSEQKHVIDDEGAMNLWTTLEESRRISVVDLFGKHVAEAHRQATDVAFEATIQPKAKAKRSNVDKEAPPHVPDPRHGAPLVRSESARQFVVQNAASPLSPHSSYSGYATSTMQARTASFVSATSTDSALGFAQMEEALPEGYSENDSMGDNCSYADAGRSKAKARADYRMDYGGEDADDEDDDMDEVYDEVRGVDPSQEAETMDTFNYGDPLETASIETVTRNAAATPTPDPNHTATSAPFDASSSALPSTAAVLSADLMLVFMRK